MIRTNGEDHVNHMFSDGVPEQGKQATVIDAEWLNAVQEEIAQFIELAGITLDGSNPHQLRDALLAIFMAGIEVGGAGINISGTGGATTVTNGGIRFQGSGLDVSLTAQGLTINGVNVKEITVQGVATLNIDETLELAKNLIVNGLTTLKGNARVNGDLVVDGNLYLENDLHSNVQGNVTGNTNGVHYGNVRTNQLMALSNGGAIAVDSEMMYSKQAHFSKGFVCARIQLVPSTLNTDLVTLSEYTNMPDGSVVKAVNKNSATSRIAISANLQVYVNQFTGLELMKDGVVWIPMNPNVEVVGR